MDSKPSDYCVPIYLNQKMVFDLLAMIEDGFSEFRDVTSSASLSEDRKNSLEAGISASNLLQFIGLSLKGGGRRDTQRSSTADDLTSEKRVHTPSSLFYKLRARLNDENNRLIREISSLEDLDNLSSGEFVEFRAILRKNPLVELLELFSVWASLGLQIEALDSGEVDKAEAQQLEDQLAQAFLGNLLGSQAALNSPNQANLTPEQLLAEQNPTYRTIKLIENALTEHGSLEIIGEMLNAPDATAVLSTRLEGFENGNLSEIIDGEFRVMGKVTRVIPSNSEGSINLLRKTPLGIIKEEQVSELTDSFKDQKDELPIEIPDVKTTIDSPAILVLPIAIFV